MTKSAIVIGAGISGLTAGFRLHRNGYAVTVLEETAVTGGKMSSLRRDGFVINRGANILPSSYTAIRTLIGELGLSCQVARSGGQLMACSSVLLNHFVKLADPKIDFLNGVPLFLTGGCNFLNQS